MNVPHLHLILNHIPTIGTGVALGLLMLAMLRRSAELTRVSLEVFAVVALLTLPAYLSGVASGMELEKMEGVDKAVIARHHDGALQSSIFMVVTGAVAWFGLWRYRRSDRHSTVNVGTVLVLGALTVVGMASTATMGGEVRHPEIMAPGVTAPSSPPAWLPAASVQRLVLDNTWFWPACEALHFIGLWLLFGTVLLVNLRVLGLISVAPFAAFHRLLPWAALGLVINLTTGMFWVIATPEQYMTNVSFFWKMTLLLLAGANLLYLTSFEQPWRIGANEQAPVLSKAMAVSAIALWIGVMYFGRMLPFLGNAF
jgi:uncharacterized membrane protein